MEERERRKRMIRRRFHQLKGPAVIVLVILAASGLLGAGIFLLFPHLDTMALNREARQARRASLAEATDPGTSGSTETASEAETEESTAPSALYEKPVSGVLISLTSETLTVGESFTLGARILPKDTDEPAILSYRSLNPGVAQVDENGQVTAVGPGRTGIVVSAGKYKRTCHLNVYSHITSAEFTEPEVELNRGDEIKLALNILPDDTTDSRAGDWSSSDENIATVDRNGRVTGVNPGDAEITVTFGEVTATCKVTVKVPLQKISFSTDFLRIRIGDTVTIPVSLSPADTTDTKEIKYTSSDESAVTVSEEGALTAVGSGTSRITATCGICTTSVEISVVVPVTGVAISQTEITLNKGEQAGLGAWVTPDDTTEDRYIDWSSDNAKVATVSGGTVSAVGAGQATIFAFHDDCTATCLVRVLAPLRGIYLNQNKLTLIEGSEGAFTVGYDPEDTTDDRTAVWTSSDESIVTVSDGHVTAVGPGTCEVSAVVMDQKVTAEVTVIGFVEVESVQLNRSSIVFENFGDIVELIAAVSPSDATYSMVSYISSNPNVATVAADGTVKAVGAGDCVITAVCGNASAECSVHVNAANIVVVLDPGHSSTYTGAYNETYGIREEVINLKVAKACRDYLLANYSGVTVYLTREDGTTLSTASLGSDLEARAQFAQDKGAAILVSMHFNASASANVSGCVCYVSNQDNVRDRSNALGNSILNQISARTGLLNRGCEWNNSDQYFDAYGNPLDYYAINRHCANRGIPGIIVEHCFMDYDTDFIRTDDSLTNFGIADAIGIAQYLGLAAR